MEYVDVILGTIPNSNEIMIEVGEGYCLCVPELLPNVLEMSAAGGFYPYTVTVARAEKGLYVLKISED